MDSFIEDHILRGEAKPIDVVSKLGQRIFDSLSASPDHVSQIDAETGEQTTCREMKDRSVRCAVWMRKLPVRPGDLVVVVTHNHLDTYIPFFATFFIDAVFNAWNHKITLHSARRLMKQFTPNLLFVCEKAADLLMEAASLENLEVRFIVFGEHSRAKSLHDILDSQTKEEIDKFVVVNERKQEDVTAIMLSSGTTGFPKGVMLSGRLLVEMASLSVESSGSYRILWYSTIDWASCLSFILHTLVRKNTRIITTHADGESFLRVTEKYKVDFAFISPTLAVYLSKCQSVKNYNLDRLACLLVGGCHHGKQLLENIQKNFPTVRIHQGYGCTETGLVATRTAKMRHIESVGYVAANCQIKFIDLESGEAVGPYEMGELYVKSPNIMIGYYKDPVATAQSYDREGWYRTGDIGYYNAVGEIFIDGRIKDIMKYQGLQVSPAEIEEILLSHPDVDEATVVSIPHEFDGDWPVAFVKIRPGSQVTKDELMELTSVLEDYKKLRGGINFMDELPYTGSGKIMRHELQRLAIEINRK